MDDMLRTIETITDPLAPLRRMVESGEIEISDLRASCHPDDVDGMIERLKADGLDSVQIITDKFVPRGQGCVMRVPPLSDWPFSG